MCVRCRWWDQLTIVETDYEKLTEFNWNENIASENKPKMIKKCQLNQGKKVLKFDLLEIFMWLWHMTPDSEPQL